MMANNNLKALFLFFFLMSNSGRAALEGKWWKTVLCLQLLVKDKCFWAGTVFIKLTKKALVVMSQKVGWDNWMFQQSFSKKWRRWAKHLGHMFIRSIELFRWTKRWTHLLHRSDFVPEEEEKWQSWEGKTIRNCEQTQKSSYKVRGVFVVTCRMKRNAVRLKRLHGGNTWPQSKR